MTIQIVEQIINESLTADQPCTVEQTHTHAIGKRLSRIYPIVGKPGMTGRDLKPGRRSKRVCRHLGALKKVRIQNFYLRNLSQIIMF